MEERRRHAADPRCRMRRRHVHPKSGSAIPGSFRYWRRPVRRPTDAEYAGGRRHAGKFSACAGRLGGLLAPHAGSGNSSRKALFAVPESVAEDWSSRPPLAWACSLPCCPGAWRHIGVPQQLACLHRGDDVRHSTAHGSRCPLRTLRHRRTDNAFRAKVFGFATYSMALRGRPEFGANIVEPSR